MVCVNSYSGGYCQSWRLMVLSRWKLHIWIKFQNSRASAFMKHAMMQWCHISIIIMYISLCIVRKWSVCFRCTGYFYFYFLKCDTIKPALSLFQRITVYDMNYYWNVTPSLMHRLSNFAIWFIYEVVTSASSKWSHVLPLDHTHIHKNRWLNY